MPSKRWTVAILLLVGALLIGLLAVTFSKPERFEGKTVRAWVAELNPQSGMEEQRQAV
jgi:hypothetical protein